VKLLKHVLKARLTGRRLCSLNWVVGTDGHAGLSFLTLLLLLLRGVGLRLLRGLHVLVDLHDGIFEIHSLAFVHGNLGYNGRVQLSLSRLLLKSSE
jgi:hypothetical protein